MPNFIGNRQVSNEEYEAHQAQRRAKHEEMLYGPGGRREQNPKNFARMILEEGQPFGLEELSILEPHVVQQICAAGLKAVAFAANENGEVVKKLVDPRQLLTEASPRELERAQRVAWAHPKTYPPWPLTWDQMDRERC